MNPLAPMPVPDDNDEFYRAAVERAVNLRMAPIEREREREQMIESAREAAREAVHTTLASLGIDTDKPVELMSDLQFLRELRDTFKKARGHAMMVVIGAMVAGIITAIWQYTIRGGKP